MSLTTEPEDDTSTHHQSLGKKSEIQILKISTSCAALLAIIGITIALYSNSLTMLLDGAYAVIDVLVSLFSIVVVRMLTLPADERYHFGYAKFEPLMAGIEGLVVVCLCVVMIAISVQQLIHSYGETNYFFPMIYAFFSAIMSILLSISMKTIGKKNHSAILLSGALMWFFDAVISTGSFFGFFLGYVTKQTVFVRWQPYIDPLMCIILAVILLRHPLHVIWHNLSDLLDANPGAEIEKDLLEAISVCKAKIPHLSSSTIKLRRGGRQLFAHIHFKINTDLPLTQLQQIEQQIRKELCKKLLALYFFELTFSIEKS